MSSALVPPSDAGWRDRADHQLVRYEALFKLLDDIQGLDDVERIAQHVVRQWKHFANVASWRLVVFTERGHTVVDGCCGEATVVDGVDLSSWDQHHHRLQRPRLVRVSDPGEGPSPPAHLTSRSCVEIKVLPIVLAGRSTALLSVAARREPFSDLDNKFIRIFGNHFADRVSDILYRRLTTEALVQTRKMEAVGRLAGGVAHGFNNLLTVIRGHVEILLEKERDADDDLRAIRTAAERAQELTGQLLAFGRKQMLQPAALDVWQVVEAMRSTLGPLLGDGIELRIERGDGSTRTQMDRGQLEQILMSLVLNSRDAMPHGGQLRIRVEGRRGEGRTAPGADEAAYIAVEVHDTGTGIQESDLPHVFDPFFTTKKQGRGTGLGLAVVHGIVTQYDGRVSVESRPGVGTRVLVLLPATMDEGEMRPAHAGTLFDQQAEPHPSTRPTILLAEDEAAVRDLVRRVLTRAGHEVLTAGGPEEAIRIVEAGTHRIDLLVTDMIMPTMNGRELAQALARSQPDLKVLFMSGYTEDELLRRGIAGGMAFLGKPFTPRELQEAVEALLDPR